MRDNTSKIYVSDTLSINFIKEKGDWSPGAIFHSVVKPGVQVLFDAQLQKELGARIKS